jgi:large subunit ribosomal protein L25
MDFVTLEAQPRTPGKRATRDARRDGLVPCVLYGAATETLSFQVPQLALRDLIYTDQFHRIKVDLSGTTYECIIKRVDFHPTEDIPRHVDFQRLTDGSEIQLRVPVNFIGNSPGVLSGGTPQEFVHKISIRCLPKFIPDAIEVDISGLEIGESILIRDVKIEGVTFNTSDDQTLIRITRPRELTDIEGDDEDVEGEEGEEGAEGDVSAEETSE